MGAVESSWMNSRVSLEFTVTFQRLSMPHHHLILNPDAEGTDSLQTDRYERHVNTANSPRTLHCIQSQ